MTKIKTIGVLDKRLETALIMRLPHGSNDTLMTFVIIISFTTHSKFKT